ncbi:MAG: EpsI family protein [Planctomycetia bacterium]|nr:EpsI family protein [Planctomycetia bacterium]
MSRWLVIVIAVAGLAAAAVVEGVRSNRWGTSEDVRVAAAKLDGVPRSFGDWTGTDVPIEPKVLRIAEAAGHVSRTYTNRKTGAQVSVLLLCGPAGPIAAHTPEVCYAGNGFSMSGNPTRKTVALPNNGSATYWSVLFERQTPPSDPLRVCWMWGVDGDWQASTNPRGEFALQAALYKLYVVQTERPVDTTRGPAPDPIHDFLVDFLPEVNKALTAS